MTYDMFQRFYGTIKLYSLGSSFHSLAFRRRLDRKLSRACRNELSDLCSSSYRGGQLDDGEHATSFHCLYQLYREQQESSNEQDPPQVRTTLHRACRAPKTSANVCKV